jgi:hypothetical protein
MRLLLTAMDELVMVLCQTNEKNFQNQMLSFGANAGYQ